MPSLSFNKKGTSIFFLFSIGIVFFFLGLALTPALTSAKNEATATAQLNCSNSSISDQNKAVCDSLDIMPFLYMGTIFGLAAMLVAGMIG